MKRIIEILSPSQHHSTEAAYDQKDANWLLKAVLMLFLLFLTMTYAHAQSGGWDGLVTTGTAGSNDYGNGVIRLLSDVNTGCAGAAVHETTPANQYNPTTGDFSHCYQVFFGCPGNDNIGSDVNGDGMAFSFWKSTATYNINNGLACGGGLGYMGSASDGKMITIEFDTWSSQGNAGFDAFYGGGTSGNHDEFALQRDGIASDAGRITSTDAFNLEDGLEHTVCITYNHTSHIFAVTISNIAGAPGNVASFSYDLTGSPYELGAYFGNVGLNQTWSSGKAGATNPSTVTPLSTTSIVANLGGVPLCPAGVEITSPSDGQSFTGCPVGPITITATPTPPASTTTTNVEFFIDGVSMLVDNSAPYSYTWSSPVNGAHVLTTTAHWSDGSISNSVPVNINVGGVQKTATVPTIDGSKEALWNSYPAFPLTKGFNSAPNLAATYRMMYDANNLYILVDVTDDVVRNDGGANYQNDGIEIYIDKGNKKQSSYQSTDYQYTATWNNTVNPIVAETKQGNNLTGVVVKQTNKVGPTGYITEMSIPWTRLGFTAGQYPGDGINTSDMGFDVSINDNDNGSRNHQLAWNDGSFGQWNNPALFGTIQFTSCDPLPVSLLNFNGKLSGSTVVLNWSTASEINNKKFVIERTSDFLNWESIGEVAGAGNSSSIQYYTLRDYTPLNGVSYYRLRQVDFDGAFAYSRAVVIQTGEHRNPISIIISPNPFEGDLTITSNVMDENMDIIIYDILGRVLYHVNHKTNNGIVLIQPELPSGTYIITIQTDSLVEKSKIIKK